MKSKNEKNAVEKANELEKKMNDLNAILRNQEIEMLLNIIEYKNLYQKIKLRYDINTGSIVRPKSISIFNDLNTTTGLEITQSIIYNNWFYTYNDKDEIEDNWKSPAYVKWIFSYRSLPDKNKEGFKLNGQFALEQNELVQPLQGLTEDSVREALKKFEVSEEFVQTVIERGAVA